VLRAWEPKQDYQQVLDAVVNKPFKDQLWQLYSDWLLKGNYALTLSGKFKKPSISVLEEWILTAWGRISSVSQLLLDLISAALVLMP
jgi:hypothetical protein